VTSGRRRPEDTAQGCRSLAENDRGRAAAVAGEHMRATLERSADAWAARAQLLDRLETSFNARIEARLEHDAGEADPVAGS
jgi:hypothetical protein